jgi:hypothetical protein
MENYFNGHSATNWYWASAGKTLTSTVTVAERLYKQHLKFQTIEPDGRNNPGKRKFDYQ